MNERVIAMPRPPDGERTPLASAQDLQVHFPRRSGPPLRAVDGVSFDVVAGETFGIIGESGSGKSTLARALVCLQPITGGSLTLSGHSPASLSATSLRLLRRDFQIIFQDPRAALNPRMTVRALVAEPLEIQGIGTRDSRRAAVLDLLDRVGLGPEFADRYAHQLSGGQRQRVNIARALTVRPKVLVCDEVVAALDVSIQADMLNLFKDLQDELGLTYVFITHDLAVVAHVSDRIAVMYLGVFMELGSKAQITDRPLHPYTRALLDAAPQAVPSYRRVHREPLQGEIPSPLAPPSGCRFRTRCPLAVEVCAAAVPAWREVQPGHFVACHRADEAMATDGADAHRPGARSVAR